MTKFCIREFDYLSISKYGTVESSQAVFNQWHAYKLKYISLFEIKWEKKKVGMIFTCNWTKRRTSLSDLIINHRLLETKGRNAHNSCTCVESVLATESNVKT